jgi:hypothetical protein
LIPIFYKNNLGQLLLKVIMKDKNFCQSCSMPLNDPELQGTEMDGSKSKDYCKYCYQNGAFTQPGISLQEMISSMISRMEKDKIPEDIIETAVSRLSNLKRWKPAYLNSGAV